MKALTNQASKLGQSRLSEDNITVKPVLETKYPKTLMDCLIKPFQTLSALCQLKQKRILAISITCSIMNISQL